MVVWDKSPYQCSTVVDSIYCFSKEEKLKENTKILGGINELFIFDVLCFQSRSFKNEALGEIFCICVLKNDKVLLGNKKGNIICFDSSFYQIIFTQKVRDDEVTCVIESKDNKIFLSWAGGWNKDGISIYDVLYLDN